MAPTTREGPARPYHFKGAPFYRIIDQFIDQAGINTDSVFGGQFKDDPGGLALKHDRKVGQRASSCRDAYGSSNCGSRCSGIKCFGRLEWA